MRIPLTRRQLPAAAAALAVGLMTPLPVSAADEVLEYSWRLMGVRGALARIFIPGAGDGRLTTVTNSAGNLETELLISSTNSRKGEFWLYRSEVDPNDRRTVRAVEEQYFRGKARAKESEIDDEQALDLASSILFLRRERPEEPTLKRIWSSRGLRPISVRPTGRGVVVLDGETLTTHRYEIRSAGEPRWEGEMDLVLADDEAATPVEIVVNRNGWKVKMTLDGVGEAQ